MKKLFVLFGLLLAATMIFAQAPQAFNYQAVVRDASGNLLENQAVGIKISLLQGSATGQEIYAETHAATTNQFGQVDLKIGTGTTTTGQFDTIAWGAGPYYLQLAVDLTGGANYAVMGTTQMLSVPYALYAEEGSGWEKTVNGISFMNGNVGIGKQTPALKFELSTPAQNQVAEQIFQISVDDAPGDYFRIGNASPGNFMFTPYIQGVRTSDSIIALYISGLTSTEKDAGSFPLVKFDARRFNGPIQNRPLFSWNNCDNPLMTMMANGNVGIGTINPTQKLAVNGTIRSKKVIVDTGWSDFVFEDDYKLMPLYEVEAFIKTNRHLPEIPSAREVEENGVSLGEISASLLQKIEELTLYVIDLKKENEQQQQLIEEQGKQLKKFEKRRNRQ